MNSAVSRRITIESVSPMLIILAPILRAAMAGVAPLLKPELLVARMPPEPMFNIVSGKACFRAAVRYDAFLIAFLAIPEE